MISDGSASSHPVAPQGRIRTRAVYLPKGVWYDYFTREKHESAGQWIEKLVDLKTLPIFVKEGTVLSYCSADRSLSDGMGRIVRTETWKDGTLL